MYVILCLVGEGGMGKEWNEKLSTKEEVKDNIIKEGKVKKNERVQFFCLMKTEKLMIRK